MELETLLDALAAFTLEHATLAEFKKAFGGGAGILAYRDFYGRTHDANLIHFWQSLGNRDRQKFARMVQATLPFIIELN